MNKENQDHMAFFDMCNAKDLYKKLESDYEILNKNHNVYNYMNFIFTARHLEEWILKDNNIDEKIRSKCKKVLNSEKNQEWETIVSICNRGKHFNKVEKYEKQKNKNTGLFDFGNIDFSNFSFRTFNYEVQVGNDMKDLDDVCEKTMKDYKVILE